MGKRHDIRLYYCERKPSTMDILLLVREESNSDESTARKALYDETKGIRSTSHKRGIQKVVVALCRERSFLQRSRGLLHQGIPNLLPQLLRGYPATDPV